METTDIDSLDDEQLVLRYPRADRPVLRVNFVTSLDGAVTVDGLSAGLSSAADKRVFALLRMVCDGLLVGAGTVREENYHALTLDEPRRAWRARNGLTPYPRLIIASGSLRLDPGHRVFTEAPVRPLILTSPTAAAEARAALEPVADLLISSDLGAAVAQLHGMGISQLLCEGGPTLFGDLTASDLVDELCLTVSPVLAGPGASRITAGSPHRPRRLVPVHTLAAADGSLLLRYRRLQGPGPQVG